MSKSTTANLLGALPFLLFTTLSNGQTTPDAGALQQQIERDRQGVLPHRVAPNQSVLPVDNKPVTGRVIPVKTFRIAGNTLLSTEQLTLAVTPYINRSLSFEQLQAAAAAVAEAYRAAGWVVNAYLPDQDIKNDEVTIQVVEAVFSGVRIEGQVNRINSDRLIRSLHAQQALGAPLNADAIDRALLLADDLPGVAVSGSLRAGQRENQTELIYKVADEPLVVGEVRADNYGAYSTGATRLSSNLYINSPAEVGDLVVGNFMFSEGSQYARMSYTVPVGYDGWQLGANASYMDYKLVNAAIKGKGTSQSTGLEARYPLIRSRLKNLFFSANADHKLFDNRTDIDAVTTQYGMDVSSIGLSGNLFDNFGGGGANSASLSYVSGHRNNQVGTTDSNFSKSRYAVSRQQTLTSDVSFYAGFDGQHSPDNLDTSESFYLGGINGVRAYPVSEGRGSSGDLTKLELRWRMQEGFVLTGFYDYGRVRNHDTNPNYSLKGAGAALSWQTSDTLQLAATWAHRIGSNPNPVSSGNDQDGTLTKNRFWLSATLNF